MNPATNGDDLEFVPVSLFEQVLRRECERLVGLLRREQPAPGSNPVDTSGFFGIDFDLIALRFSLRPLAPERESGVESSFGWYHDFELRFEVGHLEIRGDPAVCFREKVEFAVLGLEPIDLGAWSPAVGGLSVEQIDPAVLCERRCDEREKYEERGLHGAGF